MDEFIDSDGVVLTKAEYRAGMAKGRVRQLVVCKDPSLTDQSKREDADLNVLVARWMRGDGIPVFPEAGFGDVSELGDYQEMQRRLLEMEKAFYTLPGDIRGEFENNPAKFADAFYSPEGVSRLRELGVLPPVQDPAAVAGSEGGGGQGGEAPAAG